MVDDPRHGSELSPETPDVGAADDSASPNLPQEWHTDETRRRRIGFAGSLLWYLAALWTILVILFFCAIYLTLLLRLGGVGAWPIIGTLIGSIVLASAVPALLTWLIRRRRKQRGAEPPATGQ